MNKDCKYYRQHYSFNPNVKHFIKLDCGHCIKLKKNCENCKYYIPELKRSERVYFSTSLTLTYIKKALDKLASEISKM